MSIDLLRKAARLGPGYRGRREFREDQREALLAEFKDAGLDPPPYLEREIDWIDRRAKLFEAGDYPDKGVAASRETLTSLAKNFDLPVPVLIEHAAAPLQIGYLTQVEAVGDDLFGEIALSAEANALIEQSGAHSLSVGLDSALENVLEVSLVRSPRVKSAKLFSGVEFELPWQAEPDPWRERYERLISKQRRAENERLLSSYVQSGKLTPAQLPFALALMESSDTVTFDGDSVPSANLVCELLARQPARAIFGELAPSPANPLPTFLPEEADFYRRYFPDLSLDQIAAKK